MGQKRAFPMTAMASRLPAAELRLAAPRGFCAGVRRAIDAVTDAIAGHGAPVYVRRPIVHNLAVVRQLEAQGAVFVQELDEVPAGSVVVLSAHGVAPAIARNAQARGLVAYDAVCPLVSKVHREVERHYRAGRHVILIGHRGHPEIEGTLGQVPPEAATLVCVPADVASLPFSERDPLAYAVQTTFSVDDAARVVDALEARFRDLAGPPASDICYATSNRQTAVRAVAAGADAVIVVGEGFSSNAARLAELAAESCAMVQLVADSSTLDWSLLPPNGGVIGLTAAASTPEQSVEDVVGALRQRYELALSEVGSMVEGRKFGKVKIAAAREVQAA